MPFRFRPSLIPTLAAIAAVAGTISLGNWQSGRAAEKQALQDQLMARKALSPVVVADRTEIPDEWQFRQGHAQGEYIGNQVIFLDNKSQGTRVGVHVIVPMRLKGNGNILLVNLGWLARPTTYPNMPDQKLPIGQQTVDGMLVPPIKRFLELKNETAQGNLWQNLTIERARAQLGQAVLPVILHANPAGPGLEPVTELPDAGIDKHRGYAFQWYALASLVALLWLGLNLRKARQS